MRHIGLILLGLTLLKLSRDDIKTHTVLSADLWALNLIGLCLFEPKQLIEWLMIVGLVLGLAFWGKLRNSLGSGDLSVILGMGLILDLKRVLLALQFSSLLALGAFLMMKKTFRDEMPFVPFLSGGILIVYLIRLRLTFS